MNKGLLTVCAVVFAVIVVFFVMHTTSRQAGALKIEEREKVELLADAMQRMTDLSLPPQDYSFLLSVVQRNRTVPIVMTDENQHPISIRNIPPNVRTPEALADLVKEMEAKNQPILVRLPSGQFNYIYYGESTILRNLRFYPYIQMLFVAVLVLLSALIIKHMRSSEQNSLWLSMAKETAHQLGTPISSLLAWVHLLEEEDPNSEMAVSLRTDAKRFERVADRFSKIGSVPQLDDYNIERTIQLSVEYMRPRMSRRIELDTYISPVSDIVPHNSQLMQWVLENLIRNAADAMQGEEGKITLSLTEKGRKVIMEVEDNGRGMTASVRRKIFRPGFTTRARGLGLGLALARRIVRLYHHGRIYVLRSEPSKGTTFRVELPLPRA